MKTFMYPLAAVFTAILAQDINSLPACERTCLENMLREGPNFGCPAVNNGSPAPTCLCSKSEFAYGLRDCSTESCPSNTDIKQINQYGLQYCQSAEASASGTALPAIGIFSSGASAATASSGGSSSSESAGSSSSGSSSGSSSREPITTIPVISTITTGGSTEETTLGSSTIYSGETISPAGSANATGRGNETAVTTQPVVSTVSEGSTTRETTVGSTTVFSSAASSSSSAGAGATMAAPRLVPGLRGQPANFNVIGFVLETLAWTVSVIFVAQFVWTYAG